MPGFPGCQWCGGRGCISCPSERKRCEAEGAKPIFTARRDNPDDMELLKEVAHADVLKASFGPGGGGIQEIEERAVIASLKQTFRDIHKSESETPND